MSKANELTFQNDMIRQFIANGWLLGQAEHYNRELVLYPEKKAMAPNQKNSSRLWSIRSRLLLSRYKLFRMC